MWKFLNKDKIMSGEIETPKTEYIRKSDARLDMFGLQLDYIKQAVDSTKK